MGRTKSASWVPRESNPWAAADQTTALPLQTAENTKHEVLALRGAINHAISYKLGNKRACVVETPRPLLIDPSSIHDIQHRYMTTFSYCYLQVTAQDVDWDILNVITHFTLLTSSATYGFWNMIIWIITFGFNNICQNKSNKHYF